MASATSALLLPGPDWTEGDCSLPWDWLHLVTMSATVVPFATGCGSAATGPGTTGSTLGALSVQLAGALTTALECAVCLAAHPKRILLGFEDLALA